MKQLSLILSISLIISCKGQQIVPLNSNITTVPINAYFKDTNNEFNPYIGTWTATYQGKNIKLVINKEEKVPINLLGKNYFTDRLIVRYEIKTNGVVAQSTLGKDFTNDSSLSIEGLMTEDNGAVVTLIFSGGNCSIGNGLIKFKKISATQFYWNYYPGSATLNDNMCPKNLDYTIYLPETENLVFTKQ
ncbi:DUF6705 family protein [Epilithonimonas sp.]|uniref:DUF6705 family protein n=1 Tax=Epilithonimonas sp. TaxID=2894511 RepID=UPI0035AEE69D